MILKQLIVEQRIVFFLNNFKNCLLNAIDFLTFTYEVFLPWKFSSPGVLQVRREVGKSASINYLRDAAR